jgi:hypothetical protein
MRTTLTLLSTLIFTLSAQAGQDCQPENLSLEDLSIMASVRAAATDTPESAKVATVYGEGDPYGILTPEDLSIIRSVQPVGARIVLCPTDRPAQN